VADANRSYLRKARKETGLSENGCLVEVVMDAGTARVLTDEVKADAHALWAKLLALYEGGAHTALGYSSWADYTSAEFGQSRSHAYRMLDAARVVAELSKSPMGERPSERVARELEPLRVEPEVMREAWEEAVERHGPAPTAAQVREAVEPRRNGMAVHYSSETDEWSTPQRIFDVLDEEFRFTLDVCALPTSAKCERYFTPAMDGLAQEWSGSCWMNPPYGNEIGRWVQKAASSATTPDTTVVCLLPARVDTGWWWDYCRYAEVRFLRGRLKFGDADAGAPFPSAVVIFGHGPRVVWWEWR
jgi:phage N-6-adenine-methyltransferase